MAGRRSGEKPSWWNPSLYDFIKTNMDLSGWIWEFSRRYILKRILGDKPVGAMNPLPVKKFVSKYGLTESNKDSIRGDPVEEQSKNRDLGLLSLYFTYNDYLKYGFKTNPMAISSVTIPRTEMAATV